MPEGFDVSVLREPIDRETAIAAAEERIAREERGADLRWAAVWGAVQGIVLVSLAGVLAWLLLTVVYFLADGSRGVAGLIPIAVIMVLPLAVSRMREHRRFRPDLGIDVSRLERFAAANELSYVIAVSDPEGPWALFRSGSARVATHVMSSQTPRVFETADYSYETWAARARMPHQATYASFAVSRSFPTMTISPRGGPPANGWRAPAGQTRLPLDGVLAARAEVRCHPSLAEDVRAVLTPSVQEALLDVADGAGIEFAGGGILISVRRCLPLTDPVYWEWMEEMLRLVAFIDSAEPDSPWRRVDPARRARIEALRSIRGSGRAAAIGCLAPLVFGIGATVLVAVFSG